MFLHVTHNSQCGRQRNISLDWANFIIGHIQLDTEWNSNSIVGRQVVNLPLVVHAYVQQYDTT